MTKKKDIFIGRQPAIEILQSEKTVEKILIQKGALGEDLKEIRRLAEDRNVHLQYVPKEKINYILRPIFHDPHINHQGIVGFYGAIQYFKLDDIIHQIVSKGEMALFLLLDGVTDVRNVGAIARTAWCMGAHALVVPQKGAAPIGADAVKASAGALNHLPVCREKDLILAIEQLKLNGIKVLGAGLKTNKKLHEMPLNEPCALVLGSEGYGISREISQLCDDQFSIPMKSDFDSLNVSVSAGMMLYEALQQRGV